MKKNQNSSSEYKDFEVKKKKKSFPFSIEIDQVPHKSHTSFRIVICKI